MQSPLENIIAPEIKGDELAVLLTALAEREPLQWVLEIGSSTGEGSTAALVNGLRNNPARPVLFCLEASRQRFVQLAARYAREPFVRCVNASSVRLEHFPSKGAVAQFLATTRTNLSGCAPETVLGWLEEDIRYLQESGIDQGAISRIRQDYTIDLFDLVLIDGSEFTGTAELDELYGARWIVLDDINAYKNYANYQRLMADPAYELTAENWQLRNGYAVFRHRQASLPVHFFTIVLNGMPFISHHIDELRHLPFRWHWHVVEGAAELLGDTAWSRAAGGHIPASFHAAGRSVDGTSEYLDALQALFPDSITLYRKPPGQFWQGKLEMVSAPLQNIREACLLWEIDADECWTHAQLCDGWRMFQQQQDRTAAYYWCHFFVGPHLVVSSRNCYSQVGGKEWLRTWRYTLDCTWAAHEPPRLVRGSGQPVEVRPFSNDETEARGLVFQHFAYACAEQVRFKEKYYGYHQATFHWLQLQKERSLPQRLGDYLPWVKDETTVDTVTTQGVIPIPLLPDVARDLHRRSGLVVIDAVFFQYHVTGIARVWQELLERWSSTRFAKDVVILDRGKTAPDIKGYRYLDIPLHNEAAPEAEQQLLQDVCDRLGAGLFISTWHTSPLTTRSLLMVHDMIPERLLGARCQDEARWREKRTAIARAAGYVAVSQASARDLVSCYPESGAKPIHVIHNGVAENFAPATPAQIDAFRARYGIAKPYYLFVGPREWYKNFQLLLDAFQRMPDASSYCIVSPHGAHLEQEFDGHPAAGSVIVTGRLSDAELTAAYSGATALVYPSRHEGFGLPVLEAMASGCPVISSKAPALVEVGGDAALQIDPDSPEELAAAMHACQNREQAMRYVRRGLERAAAFGWQRSASLLLRAICTMLGMRMGLDNLYLEMVKGEDSA